MTQNWPISPREALRVQEIVRKEGAYKQAKSAHLFFFSNIWENVQNYQKKCADFLYIKIKGLCQHFMNQKIERQLIGE